MPIMQGQIDTIEDDFWTERLPFFTAQFPTYYRKPQQLHGRFHTSDEHYDSRGQEIIPVSERKGQRTYVMMHPYVYEPNYNVTIRLNANPNTTTTKKAPLVRSSAHSALRVFVNHGLLE
jgi:hypothetical protein